MSESASQPWYPQTAKTVAPSEFADFSELKHVLILGRCTSGIGGKYILDSATEVLAAEFPELAPRIKIRLPDEKRLRVGQPTLDRIAGCGRFSAQWWKTVHLVTRGRQSIPHLSVRWHDWFDLHHDPFAIDRE